MRYYFDDPKNQRKLEEILRSWLGTPYRHRCGVKGLGCDCIHFVAKVLEEIGLLTWRKDLMPDYPRDWHLHNSEERLAEGLERELKVERIGLEDLRDGDIVLHHYGRAAAHAGIFCGGFIYHAIDRAGVVKTTKTNPLFRKHAQFAYRMMR